MSLLTSILTRSDISTDFITHFNLQSQNISKLSDSCYVSLFSYDLSGGKNLPAAFHLAIRIFLSFYYAIVNFSNSNQVFFLPKPKQHHNQSVVK